MARGLNKVQIIGNLGADPEMRYTPSGTAVTNFRVAVSRTRRGPDGNNIDETEWFRIVAWDSPNYKLAEICDKYLRKGSKVYVEGRLQSRKYLDRDNIERTAVEIVASEMIMLDGRGDGEMGAAGAEGGMDRMERMERTDRGGGRPAAQVAGGQRQGRRDEPEDDQDIDELPF
jgi:single-strand DNA-binding protein